MNAFTLPMFPSYIPTQSIHPLGCLPALLDSSYPYFKIYSGNDLTHQVHCRVGRAVGIDVQDQQALQLVFDKASSQLY